MTQGLASEKLGSHREADAIASYDYAEATSRNIGWVTSDEQNLLRFKRVAIAGMGGVGGAHLTTLARLGIGHFHVADFDVFELANFNRQRGAVISKVGQPKVDVMADRALDINPDLGIVRFPNGVTPDNLDEFLEGVDLYVDSLDFFAVDARRMVFAACAQRGIPAITAAPLGLGTATLIFMPGKMTFEQYFRLEGQPMSEQLLRFLVGLAPRALHAKYLVDPTTLDLQERKGPSTVMACEMSAGITGVQALKILLDRGPIIAAPSGMHYDAFRNKVVRTWRPGGNANPIQRAIISLARRKLGSRLDQAASTDDATIHVISTAAPAIQQVMDMARWAPSGDNVQNWQFEVVDKQGLVIHGHDTRDHCVYDLQGRASQLAVGALIENVAIAATRFGWKTNVEPRPNADDRQLTYDVRFESDPDVVEHSLIEQMPRRCTNRRPFETSPLTSVERIQLEEAVGPGYRVVWLASPTERFAMAKLLFRSAHIRLTTREAYDVHRQVIEWRAQYSNDRIPDQAVGLDAMTTRLMQWAMASWGRVRFLNTCLAGTIAPRLQLDFLPGMRCGAHFLIVANDLPLAAHDYVTGGRALQRFWLTASALGLQFQPEMTPLVFDSYARQGIEFTKNRRGIRTAGRISRRLEAMFGRDTVPRAVFLGRIGHGKAPTARSLRKPLTQLMTTSPTG